jgi:hypothetical protein
MHTVHEIVEEAKRLPVPERRRLIHEIESSLELEKDQKAAPQQLLSGSSSGRRYAQTLALAGSLHSDYRDVAGDKYKHLAEIYADNHEKVR